MKSLYMVSLGCPKNLVDSEVMLAELESAGYAIVETPIDATLLLVNTCGFIQPAVEEAIDEILAMASYKEQDPSKILVVTGCLVQRYGHDLAQEFPEVDLFIGLDDFPHIAQLVHTQVRQSGRVILAKKQPSYLMNSTVARRLATPFFRAFLKITDGCDNHCAYCMIPSIRGRLRSRTIADIVQEAKNLDRAGVKELSLVAQDLTAFGRDLANGDDLVRLLHSLLKHTGIPWIRLLYLYPANTTDALLQLMAEEPRIVPYLDIPFQHVSDQVLRRMNRPYGHTQLDTLVRAIRQYVPGCAIRTTLLIGFPGETEADIDVLQESLASWQLDHVGVFRYQDEEGSVAATMDNKVPEEEQDNRYQRIMEQQAAISEHLLARYVGRVEPVLIEGISKESDLLLEGRTRFQAPDIDGCVYITSGQVNPGDIVAVQITEAHTYDLVGEVLNEEKGTSEQEPRGIRAGDL